jgi:hypothetical protein
MMQMMGGMMGGAMSLVWILAVELVWRLFRTRGPHMLNAMNMPTSQMVGRGRRQ